MADNAIAVKNWLCAAIGAVGGWIAHMYGGWNSAMAALITCMAVDYVTGLIVAGVFQSSIKSAGGGLDSRVGWKGLCRKFVTLLIVLVAHQMDALMGSAYIRDAVVIGFCANEVISILENAGLMGLPVPKMLSKVLDQLKEKADANGGKKV